MKYLNVRLRQPNWMLHPMQQFIREAAVVEYEELQSWNFIAREDDVEYELFYVEAEREPYLDALDAVESVQWYDVEVIDDDSFYVYLCQQTRPEDETWREAFTALNLVVVPPVVYDTDAAFSMTVVGDADDLQAMLDALPTDVEVTVEAVGTYDHRYASVVGDLTAHQREALEVGVEVGYFEVPREGSVSVVADELGCSESTAATHLQKAQSRIVRRLVGRYGRQRMER